VLWKHQILQITVIFINSCCAPNIWAYYGHVNEDTNIVGQVAVWLTVLTDVLNELAASVSMALDCLRHRSISRLLQNVHIVRCLMTCSTLHICGICMIICGFYMCLLLTEHLIGCELDTGEQLKRKTLGCVRLKTVSYVANKIDICDQNVCTEYKLGYWNVH